MQSAPTPRARYREQTRKEIKEAALRQLAAGGSDALALTRIAKEMGLSGPALYRYFTGRDDLLNALVRDAYDDAATAIGRAAAMSSGRRPRARLHALAGAYRSWAVAQPHRYLLTAGTPLPGYTAPADTLKRARAVLGPFLPVFAAADPAAAMLPLVRQMADWMEQDAAVADWVAQQANTRDSTAGGRALAGAVLAWSGMHGVVSLEAAGRLTGMGHRPEALFTAQIDLLADGFRLP
jgi:AcrR family transcriptional regulator